MSSHRYLSDFKLIKVDLDNNCYYSDRYYLDLTYADKLKYYHDTKILEFVASTNAYELGMGIDAYIKDLYELVSGKSYKCCVRSRSDSTITGFARKYFMCIINDIQSISNLSVASMLPTNEFTMIGSIKLFDGPHQLDDEFISKAIDDWNNYFIDEVVSIYLGELNNRYIPRN